MSNRIRELRKEKGLSIDELSNQLKKRGVSISAASISKYERGERNPKIENWIKLADFFNVDVAYLQGINQHKNTHDIFLSLDKAKKGRITHIINNQHNKDLINEIRNTYPYSQVRNLKVIDKAFASIDVVIPNYNGRQSSYFDYLVSKAKDPYELSNIVSAMKQFYRIYVNALIGNAKAQKDREILEKALSEIQGKSLGSIKKDTRPSVSYPLNKAIGRSNHEKD